METMTVKQALEGVKGLTIEQVLASLVELRESNRDLGQRIDQTTANVDALTKVVKEVHDKVGGVGNTLGGVMEDMFTTNVCSKFNIFGYTFTQTSRDMVIRDKSGKKIAEIDAFLENGDYVMAVEVKSQLEIYDINKHLERLEKLRKYMDGKGD
jgi:NifU-like protein involved in Fe-S cluster formation